VAGGEGGRLLSWQAPVLQRREPVWDIWKGVNGMFYGWLRRSSPPRVLRARGKAGLKSKIRAEARRADIPLVYRRTAPPRYMRTFLSKRSAKRGCVARESRETLPGGSQHGHRGGQQHGAVGGR